MPQLAALIMIHHKTFVINTLKLPHITTISCLFASLLSRLMSVAVLIVCAIECKHQKFFFATALIV